MEQNINILVVEDDNDINQLLCKIIKKSNYFPQPAYSGTEALLYLEKQKWDLVLLDLMLPGMTGEEILAEITKKDATPVIIISAKSKQQTKISTFYDPVQMILFPSHLMLKRYRPVLIHIKILIIPPIITMQEMS